MKKTILLIMICAVSILSAQIPTDYVARYDFSNNLANTVTGGAALTPTNTNYVFVNNRHSNPNAALDFNGASMTGYTYTASTSSPQNEVAMSFWVKLNLGTVNAGRRIVQLFNVNSTGFYIDRLPGTKFRFSFRQTAGNQKFVDQDLSSIYDNQWHNIVYTVKRTSNDFIVTIYVDGVAINTTALNFYNVATNTAIWDSNAMLELAPKIGSGQYSSAIDDVLLFNRALTSNEAVSIATGGSCNTGNDDTTGFTASSPFSANYLLGTKYTLSQVGTLNAINLIGKGTNSGVQMAVYDDNAGTPNNLIASATGTVSNGVVSLPVTPVVLQPGDYWVMAVYQHTNSHTYLKTSVGHPVYYQSLPYGNAIPTNASSFSSTSGQEYTYFLDIDCGDTLSTTSFNIDNEITIYPNPTSNMLHITSKHSHIEQVEIYSITGKKVKQTTNSQNINIENLSNGVYFIKIKSNYSEAIKKFIKQ